MMKSLEGQCDPLDLPRQVTHSCLIYRAIAPLALRFINTITAATMSSPFFFDDSRSRTASDDAMSDASNFEHLCVTDEPGTLEDVHYWYGKLYLAFRLAKSIVREVGPDITADELDVYLSHNPHSVSYTHLTLPTKRIV